MGKIGVSVSRSRTLRSTSRSERSGLLKSGSTQAEARAFARTLRGKERIVNAVDVFRVDAVPAVDHLYLDSAIVLAPGFHFQDAAGSHGVPRVDEQVEKYLLQLTRIACDGRRGNV